MPLITKRFHRKYRVLIGRHSQAIVDTIPSSLINPKFIDRGATPSGLPLDNGDFLDFSSIPAKYFEITDEDGDGLNFRAEIDQTKSTSTINFLEFSNLPEDQVRLIKKDDTVIVLAGYDQTIGERIYANGVGEGWEDLPTLLVAQIAAIETKWMGSEKTTRIVCGEAITVTKNAKVSKSYPPFTTREQVLDNLLGIVKSVGIPVARVSLDVEPITASLARKPLMGGYVAKGNLMEEVKRLCDAMYLNCYTVLGRLYVEPKTQDPTVLFFEIIPDNVLGLPEPMSDNLTTASNDGNKGRSFGELKIDVWLDGRISVDKGARLKGFEDYGGYDGDYKITSVSHKMDFRSKSTWMTSLTLQPID